MKLHVLFKTTPFYALLKKKHKMVSFELYYVSSSSFGHVQAGEEEVFFLCNASLPTCLNPDTTHTPL